MSHDPGDDVLDDPVGEALRGAHAHLARREGRVLAYRPDVATFTSVPGDPTDDDWADVARLYGPGGFVETFTAPGEPPSDWSRSLVLPGVQMVATDATPVGAPGPDVVVLGPDDVPEMLDLAARTKPGPFWARTIEMGTYVGIRDGGVLLAMAGERMRPPGWTEVSAVCTTPEARGRGLAARVVLDVATRVRERGERPFLHVVDGNPARLLYERLGFVVRRPVTFRGFTLPDPGLPASGGDA